MTITIDMTPQEAFDKIVEHFSQPGAQFGYHGGTCSYFDSDTKAKCAVGCLLSDQEASRLEYEANEWSQGDTSLGVITKDGVLEVTNPATLEFLLDAQALHDGTASAEDEAVIEFVIKLKNYWEYYNK
jgi:hypothetical protein